MTWVRAAALAALTLGVACGDDMGGGDDASVDAPSVDAGRDAGRDARVCPMSCGANESCCPDDEGNLRCIDVLADDQNCGGCDIVCADGRGTACENGSCVCGRNPLGCAGDPGNVCCPPTDERVDHYCANLLVDGNDCGECGVPCRPEVGNTCAAGRCFCGEGTDSCDGTRGSTCCENAFGASCADLDTDREHCGACERRCDFGEDCVSGECQERIRDAGPVDAGTDSGPADAGPPGPDASSAGKER